MKSGHLVDRELVDGIDKYSTEPLSHEMLPRFRTEMAAALNSGHRTANPAVSVTARSVPGPKGAPQVPVVIFSPTWRQARRPAICYLHGGGFVFGSPAMMAARHETLCLELDCVIVSVDYRHAPETPFPGAVEDCYAVLAWMNAKAAGLGIDPRRIATAGHSAGAGLAACLTLLARDRGEFGIALQHLVNPMLDDRTVVSRDPHPFAGEFVWTPDRNAFGWRALLGVDPGAPGVSPYAAAARAEALEGLPPTFISIGALDLFLEESLEYGRRLTRAGVPLEMHVYPGAYHGSSIMAEARLSKVADRDGVEAFRQALKTN